MRVYRKYIQPFNMQDSDTKRGHPSMIQPGDQSLLPTNTGPSVTNTYFLSSLTFQEPI